MQTCQICQKFIKTPKFFKVKQCQCTFHTNCILNKFQETIDQTQKDIASFYFDKIKKFTPTCMCYLSNLIKVSDIKTILKPEQFNQLQGLISKQQLQIILQKKVKKIFKCEEMSCNFLFVMDNDNQKYYCPNCTTPNCLSENKIEKQKQNKKTIILVRPQNPVNILEGAQVLLATDQKQLIPQIEQNNLQKQQDSIDNDQVPQEIKVEKKYLINQNSEQISTECDSTNQQVQETIIVPQNQENPENRLNNEKEQVNQSEIKSYDDQDQDQKILIQDNGNQQKVLLQQNFSSQIDHNSSQEQQIEEKRGNSSCQENKQVVEGEIKQIEQQNIEVNETIQQQTSQAERKFYHEPDSDEKLSIQSDNHKEKNLFGLLDPSPQKIPKSSQELKLEKKSENPSNQGQLPRDQKNQIQTQISQIDHNSSQEQQREEKRENSSCQENKQALEVETQREEKRENSSCQQNKQALEGETQVIPINQFPESTNYSGGQNSSEFQDQNRGKIKQIEQQNIEVNETIQQQTSQAETNHYLEPESDDKLSIQSDNHEEKESLGLLDTSPQKDLKSPQELNQEKKSEDPSNQIQLSRDQKYQIQTQIINNQQPQKSSKENQQKSKDQNCKSNQVPLLSKPKQPKQTAFAQFPKDPNEDTSVKPVKSNDFQVVNIEKIPQVEEKKQTCTTRKIIFCVVIPILLLLLLAVLYFFLQR